MTQYACIDCGEPCSSKGARCMVCWAITWRGPGNPNWKGEAVKAVGYSGRGRARRWYPIDGDLCERCQQASAFDRHHRDGNTLNNDAENIERLCRRCHMEADGRLQRLANQASDAGRARRGKVMSPASRRAREELLIDHQRLNAEISALAGCSETQVSRIRKRLEANEQVPRWRGKRKRKKIQTTNKQEVGHANRQ